jgi:hypothetical protein
MSTSPEGNCAFEMPTTIGRPISFDLVDRRDGSPPCSALGTCKPAPRQGDEVVAHTKRGLKRLARDIYEAACDLCALGPYAEDKIVTRTGFGVVNGLAELDEEIRTLIDQLHSARAGYLSAQLESLGVNAQSRGLKLHIGCGARHLKGWINIDNYPAPLSMSALWDLPFGDASVARIFVARIPECLFFPVEIRRFLFEMRRVLTLGGLLQVAMLNRKVDPRSTPANLELAYKKWARSLEHRTRIDYLLETAGADLSRVADKRANRATCSSDALIHMLLEERFTSVTSVDWPEPESDDSIEGREVEFPAPRMAREGCFCIEARKPLH